MTINLQEKYKEWCQKTAKTLEMRQPFLNWYQLYQQKKIQQVPQDVLNWEHFLENHFLSVQDAYHFLNKTFPYPPEPPSNISVQQTILYPKKTSLSSEILEVSPSEKKSMGPYEILEKLGQGGMGTVYKVRHRFLNQIAVLKLILPSGQNTPELLERFHRESQIMAKLKHPHIVQVYDSGEENGQHYFVMEYVPGVSLQKKIQDDLPIRESIRLILQVLDALEYAHSEGVLHRDLKPENIFVTPDGNVKLGDFGLAKRQAIDSQSKRLTKSGEVFGSPAYMAPEQATGETSLTDSRTDIYGIGVCLYEMFTLRCPHEGDSLGELLLKIVTHDVLPPSTINPDLHPDLDSVILKALAKEKKDRYSSAKELAEDLNRFLEGYPVLAKPPDWRKKANRWVRRNRKIFIAVLSGILILFPLEGFHQWVKKKQFRAKIYTVVQNLKEEQTQHDLIKALESLKQLHPDSDSLLKELEFEKWKISKKLVHMACIIACTEEDYSFAELLSREVSLLKTIPEAAISQLFSHIKVTREAKQIANLKRLDYWINEFEAGRVTTSEKTRNAIFEVSRMKETKVVDTLLSFLEKSLPYFLEIKENQEKEAKTLFYYFVVRVLGRLENSQAIVPLYKNFLILAKHCSKLEENERSLPQIRSLIFMLNSLVQLNIDQREDIDFEEKLLVYQRRFGLNSLFTNLSVSIYKKIAKKKTTDLFSSYENAQEIDKKILMNDLAGAIELLSLEIQKDPTNIDAYNNRGVARIRQNDFKGALEDFEKVLRLDPLRMEGYFHRGMIQDSLGNYDEALLDFNKALTLPGEHYRIYFYRGVTKKNKGDLLGAIADYTESIHLNSKNLNVYFYRGHAKKLTNDFIGALADYNEIIRLDPENENGYVMRGSLKLILNDFAGSLRDYNEAIRLNPQNFSFYLERGMAKETTKDVSGAISDYNEAIQLKPNESIAFYHRARLKIFQNRPRDAFADLNKAIQLNPKYVDAHFALGKLLGAYGDSVGALKEYNQCILLNPQYYDAYYFRGILHLNLKNSEGAKADFKKVLELTQHLPLPEKESWSQKIFSVFPDLKK